MVSISPDGRQVISASERMRVWDVENGMTELHPNQIGIPEIFLDGHTLFADRFLDLPFFQVWATQSLVVICHKIGDNILVPQSLPKEANSETTQSSSDTTAISTKYSLTLVGLTVALGGFLTMSIFLFRRR
jgi:hypothetical protein